MRTAAEYKSIIDNNPAVRRFLNFIGKAEGADYNIGYGGRRITNFAWHPYAKCSFRRTGEVNSSGRCSGTDTSAAGKYQFVRGTWDRTAKALGLKDFTPASQDIAAVALLDGRGALTPLLRGGDSGFGQAVNLSRSEWESFKTRTWTDLQRIWSNVGGDLTVSGSEPSAQAVQASSTSSVSSFFGFDWLFGTVRSSNDAYRPFVGQQGSLVSGQSRLMIALAIAVIVVVFAWPKLSL